MDLATKEENSKEGVALSGEEEEMELIEQLQLARAGQEREGNEEEGDYLVEEATEADHDILLKAVASRATRDSDAVAREDALARRTNATEAKLLAVSECAVNSSRVPLNADKVEAKCLVGSSTGKAKPRGVDDLEAPSLERAPASLREVPSVGAVAVGGPQILRHQQQPPEAVLTSRLAVASPVGGDGWLQEAREVESNPTKNEGRSIAVWLGSVVLLAGVLLIVVFSVSGTSSDSSNNDTTLAPTSSVLTTESDVLSLLPEHTLASIEKGKVAQLEALDFVVGDPNLFQYPTWRVVQRFALAALYFATGGPTQWTQDDHWLSYGVHECDWFYGVAINDDFGGVNINITVVEAPFHTPCERDPSASYQDNDPETAVYKHVSLGDNRLRGTLPEEMYMLTSLRSIMLVNNALEGTLSTRLGLLTNLEAIDNAKNYMTGSIPSEIGLLGNVLTRVYVLLNQFDGTIPTEMGRLTNVVDFFLDTNQLTGTIPTELGQISDSLWRMWIGRNQLSGTIPTEFRRFTNLESLWLAENQLSGGLDGLGYLAANCSLGDFTCSGNSGFVGKVPDAMCETGFNVFSMNCTTTNLCGCHCPCVET